MNGVNPGSNGDVVPGWICKAVCGSFSSNSSMAS